MTRRMSHPPSVCRPNGQRPARLTRRLAHPLIGLTMAFMAASGYAQSNEYRLELVVFHRGQQAVQTVQHYSPASPVALPTRFNSLGAPSESEPEVTPGQNFATSQPQRLANAINRLQAKDGYRVLYAAAWHQPLVSARNTIPLRVRGLERAPEVYELDGTISISLDRFLQAQVDLGFSELNLLPGIPAAPSADTLDPLFMAEDSLVAEAAQHTVQTLLGEEPASEWQATASYRITTRSSLESGEVNYLDHPYLGILLYVEPVKTN